MFFGIPSCAPRKQPHPHRAFSFDAVTLMIARQVASSPSRSKSWDHNLCALPVVALLSGLAGRYIQLQRLWIVLQYIVAIVLRRLAIQITRMFSHEDLAIWKQTPEVKKACTSIPMKSSFASVGCDRSTLSNSPISLADQYLHYMVIWSWTTLGEQPDLLIKKMR